MPFGVLDVVEERRTNVIGRRNIFIVFNGAGKFRSDFENILLLKRGRLKLIFRPSWELGLPHVRKYVLGVYLGGRGECESNLSQGALEPLNHHS